MYRASPPKKGGAPRVGVAGLRQRAIGGA